MSAALIRKSDPTLDSYTQREDWELRRRSMRYPIGSAERTAFAYAADRMFDRIDYAARVDLAKLGQSISGRRDDLHTIVSEEI
jgi:hypothetical protein